MKTTIASLLISAALASAALAGPATFSGKGPVTPLPEPSCFGPGLDVGVFGGGFLPRHSHDDYDNALGGGVLVDYFFSKYCGVEFSYGAFATASTEHLFNGDFILRAPIESICVAPYLMVGGGFHVDGETVGEYHAGAGVEVRFKSLNHMGVFADGAYYWHGDGDRNRDFTLVRLGVKFHL